jgi:hypothetical protein
MLNNYPAAYLFILSLLSLLVLTFITPLVADWHILIAILLESLSFVLRIICIFFLFSTVIELINNIHFKKRQR